MGHPSSQRTPEIEVAVCVLALFSFATGACIPRGDPPAGRQIVADAAAKLLGLVPSNGDGLLRAMFLRPGKGPDFANLYVVSVDASGGPPVERLLLTDVQAEFTLGCPRAGGRCPWTDSRGRVYLSKSVSAVGVDYGVQELFRVDPVTGESRDLGQGFAAIFSPSGQRVVVPDNSGGNVIYEADDTETPFEAAQSQFVGEVLFYLTAEGDLMRIVPGGVPERLATGVSALGPANEQLVLLVRSTAEPDMSGQIFPNSPDPADDTGTLLDTTTLAETPLPAGLDYRYGSSFSPDGRWIAATAGSYGGVVLFDRQTGTMETLESGFAFFSWRPGHTELWASLVSDVSSSLLIKRPGEPTITIPAVEVTGEQEDDTGRYTGFTADGAYWFATSHVVPMVPPEEDHIGVADDPTGLRLPLVPEASSCREYWRLQDGRLLVASFTGTGFDAIQDFDVRAVDPNTGASQPYGERGFVTAVGQTRFLGIFHASYERGDLTSFELATGQSTILAPEFAMEAFAEPRGADPYPSGGRFVYQFRARFASPWDGLWLGTAP